MKAKRKGKTTAVSDAVNGTANDAANHIADSLRSLAFPIAELVHDPANARTHSPDNIAAIKASLRVYGQRKPIVVNKRTGHVEAGNGTLTAARELGWNEIAAVFVDDDAATAAGFSIADNRTAELADWDSDALRALMEAVETSDEDLAAMMAKLAEDTAIIPSDGESAGEDLKEQFNVMVDCGTEAKQLAMIERLESEGYTCKALTF